MPCQGGELSHKHWQESFGQDFSTGYYLAPARIAEECMAETDPDWRIRSKAIAWVQDLHKRNGTIAWGQLEDGFPFHGERIHLATKAGGIFKPRQMGTLLSIKTVIPRRGRKARYDDQSIDQAVFGAHEHFEYSFMQGTRADQFNRLLIQACKLRLPIIYFVGVAPSLYEPIVPAMIHGFDTLSRKCFVGPSDLGQSTPGGIPQGVSDGADKRRYRVGLTQQRLHQSMFRARVLTAYGNRCAITGLPVARLLDAAHIVEDNNETLGQPEVRNGLPLSKIHHAAFDADLIGIDPDHKIHLSTKLLDEDDGPMLELLKGSAGKKMHLPSRCQDYPDPARLELRFERFRPNL